MQTIATVSVCIKNKKYMKKLTFILHFNNVRDNDRSITINKKLIGGITDKLFN